VLRRLRDLVGQGVTLGVGSTELSDIAQPSNKPSAAMMPRAASRRDRLAWPAQAGLGSAGPTLPGGRDEHCDFAAPPGDDEGLSLFHFTDDPAEMATQFSHADPRQRRIDHQSLRQVGSKTAHGAAKVSRRPRR
jgi:hypothetical protein